MVIEYVTIAYTSHSVIKVTNKCTIAHIEYSNLTIEDVKMITTKAFESNKRYAESISVTLLFLNNNLYSVLGLSQFVKISLNKISSKRMNLTNDHYFDDDNDEGDFEDILKSM